MQILLIASTRTHVLRPGLVGPRPKFLAKSENKAGADSNRLRPPNLPRRINKYVRGLSRFLVSLPLLQFGPCYPTSSRFASRFALTS